MTGDPTPPDGRAHSEHGVDDNDGEGDPLASRHSTRMRRLLLPAAIAVLVLAGSVVPLPAYIEMPGSATGIPDCVTIADRPDASVNGDFLFTTVGQRDATVFGLLIAAVRSDQRVVGREELLDGVQRDRYLQLQRRQFLDATDRAVVVALRAAGLQVTLLGDGIDVVEVMPDTPADGVLQPDDVIVAIDDVAAETTADLIAAVDDAEPVQLRIRRDGRQIVTELRPQVTEVDGQRRPIIGVRIMTRAPAVQLPFEVDFVSGSVGGPSAGLMVGLAVNDLVDDADVAGGNRVAGTGTLSVDGAVGPIDGIELKVAAAAREGVDVFIAPQVQADAARAAVPAGSGIDVVGVATFDEARSAVLRAAQAAETGPEATTLATGDGGGCRLTVDA